MALLENFFGKHLHILLAFPNTYFANLEIKGKFKVNPQIKTEVQLMLDPQAVIPEASPTTPDKFGVSDVFDFVCPFRPTSCNFKQK